MLLLFCLLIGYGVIRLWEDTTARWRNETPPRHEHRMERMRQRAAAGAPPPASGLRRYVAGLADDVWSSAHEKRQLMDDARRIKREEKAKRKAAKIIARQRAKTDKALGFSAAVPNDTATPADTAAPAAEPLPPAATAAGTPVSPPGHRRPTPRTTSLRRATPLRRPPGGRRNRRRSGSSLRCRRPTAALRRRNAARCRSGPRAPPRRRRGRRRAPTAAGHRHRREPRPGPGPGNWHRTSPRGRSPRRWPRPPPARRTR